MIQIRPTHRGANAAALLSGIVLALLAANAQATALFAGAAEARLTIDSIFNEDTASFETVVPTGLLIEGDQDGITDGSSTGGIGSASASWSPDNASPVGVGESVTGDASVSGSASSGGVDALAWVFGEINPFGVGPTLSLLLDNGTATTYTVTLTLDYELSASASVDGPTELASADAMLDVLSLFGSFDHSELVEAAAPGVGSPASIIDSMTFSVTLVPDDFEGFDVSVFASGFAKAPEPGTLLLAGLGLPILTLVRRRRTRAG